MNNIKLFLSILFVLTIVIVGCSNSNQVEASESYVTIDINPSVEFTIDENEIITYVSALNDDGDTLLLELDLVGLPLNDALTLVIEKATELGFIDPESEDTLVQITTVADDEESEEELGEEIEDHINKTFRDKGMKGIARKKQMTSEIIQRANELGVAPGFLRLVESVQEVNPDLTLQEALKMKVKDLISMLKTKADEIKDLVRLQKEEFFARRDQIRAEYKVQIEAIQAQIQQLEESLVTALEEEKAEIEANIEALEAGIEELIKQMQAEIKALMVEYKTKAQEFKNKVEEKVKERKDQYKAKVEEFRKYFEEHKDEIKQLIEQWQNLKRQGKDK